MVISHLCYETTVLFVFHCDTSVCQLDSLECAHLFIYLFNCNLFNDTLSVAQTTVYSIG
jgi:hypothetical protein